MSKSSKDIQEHKIKVLRKELNKIYPLYQKERKDKQVFREQLERQREFSKKQALVIAQLEAGEHLNIDDKAYLQIQEQLKDEHNDVDDLRRELASSKKAFATLIQEKDNEIRTLKKCFGNTEIDLLKKITKLEQRRG